MVSVVSYFKSIILSVICDLSEERPGDEPEAVVDAELVLHHVVVHDTRVRIIPLIRRESEQKVLSLEVRQTETDLAITNRVKETRT